MPMRILLLCPYACRTRGGRKLTDFDKAIAEQLVAEKAKRDQAASAIEEGGGE
jgi:IS5 family transposase